MIRVAVAGYGYWGPNLARNVTEVSGLELVAVADLDRDRLELARRRHPLVQTQSLKRVAAHDGVDALIVATPPGTHYEIARAALERGWHVLVAKPLTLTSHAARELTAIAEERGLVLMADHTFVHTGAVRALASLDLGRPLYYDSVRVNLGLFQSDIDVLWDLAPHDLSIVRAVFPGEEPTEVACVAEDRSGNGQADVAWLTVWHRSGFVAHAHLSWLSPVKVRRALLAGDRRMAVYDDMEPSEKVRVYDSGVTVEPGPETHRALVDYRTGDCHAPHLDFTEALRVELGTFVDLVHAARIASGVLPLPECLSEAAADAVEVVRLLEAADLSRVDGGCRVPV